MEDHNLALAARESGEYFLSQLNIDSMSKVRDVRAHGLMIGIELKERVQATLLELMERGILALPAGPTVLRLLPPLVIEREQLDTVAGALNELLA